MSEPHLVQSLHSVLVAPVHPPEAYFPSSHPEHCVHVHPSSKYHPGSHAGGLSHGTHSVSEVCVHGDNCWPGSQIRSLVHVPHWVFASAVHSISVYSSVAHGVHSTHTVSESPSPHGERAHRPATHSVQGSHSASLSVVQGFKYSPFPQVSSVQDAQVVSDVRVHALASYSPCSAQLLHALQNVPSVHVPETYSPAAQSCVQGTHRGPANVEHSSKAYSPIGQDKLSGHGSHTVFSVPSHPLVLYCPSGQRVQSEQIESCSLKHPPDLYCVSRHDVQIAHRVSWSGLHWATYSPDGQSTRFTLVQTVQTVSPSSSHPPLLYLPSGQSEHGKQLSPDR